ncbi:hypothetical protein [Paenibacillus herberti]|uniref:Uncharacterized protein n=1 Tax=Paenibacillus herberti TaxID=1619309 RepID=A0A229P3N6_9BACL|nr:hypothetical protein [Paenibacillus herberti]OXM16489.1 hypothetical protein CGZ75_07395 [Paenibacillus herberti]
MPYLHGKVILILFILLVLASAFVSNSPQRNKQLKNDFQTNLSIGFNIYNHTSDFSLVSASLEGEFESPFPSTHIILPDQSHHFEVRSSGVTSYSAYVTYNVISGTETVGDIRINMRTTPSAYFGIPVPSTIVDFIDGPIRYDNGGTYVTILDSDPIQVSQKQSR